MGKHDKLTFEQTTLQYFPDADATQIQKAALSSVCEPPSPPENNTALSETLKLALLLALLLSPLRLIYIPFFLSHIL